MPPETGRGRGIGGVLVGSSPAGAGPPKPPAPRPDSIHLPEPAARGGRSREEKRRRLQEILRARWEHLGGNPELTIRVGRSGLPRLERKILD